MVSQSRPPTGKIGNGQGIAAFTDADAAMSLRSRAEEIFGRRHYNGDAKLSPDEAAHLFHELRVHQIELEMQNEELKRAHLELDASHARYFDLYDLAPVGYLTVSEKGIVEQANLTAVTLLGADSRNALLRQPLTRFILPADQDIFYRHRKKLFDTGDPQMCELRMKFSDQGEFWVRLDANLERDANDGTARCRVVLTNISDQKHAEKEKEKLLEQLAQAIKMESIGRLAGGVAHDFNNMLGVILGNLELAFDHVTPDEPLFVELTSIRNAARRSAKITEQLLAFARKQNACPQVLDMNGTVEGLFSMLKGLIGEHIDLAWQPGANLWTVNMDPAQIDQIIVNLCLNARDAIGGSGRIVIETGHAIYNEDDCRRHTNCTPGQYVVLSVSDNGCGMTRESLDHLFEPFFTTKKTGQGTGMGLASAHGIILQNNGFITVDSEPGRGTTFKIHLPRYEGAAVTAPAENTSLIPAGEGETVLIAEDEPTLLDMTAKMLQRQGYTVLCARTPLEAMHLAGEHAGKIKLLITDVVMPGMNGQQLAAKITAQHAMKCLFMSGYTSDIISHHGVMDSGVAFIQKPFTKMELALKVRTLLDD